MSTDASVIRAGRYAEIGAIIRRDSTALIDRWARRAAEEQPTAKRVHQAVLLDDLPYFLEELGDGLAAAGGGGPPPHWRLAHIHAEQRWQTGWSLTEVIRDYRILRLVVLEYLDESLDRPLRLAEIQAIGLALDEAIEVSVGRYVRNREEQLRRLEEGVRTHSDALRAADRRKNEFLATLAHELRNPLAPLRNALEVVRLDGDSPATVRQVREVMVRQVEQMTRLVEDLLDVARIAEGKLVLRTETLDLRPALEDAVQMNAPLVAARKHRLSVHLPPGPLCVAGDRARLVQVFVNLLNNAAKYTDAGGEIAVAAAKEGNEAVVTVGDSGTGIAPDMLPHVFDLYTQIDVSADRPQGGLGIGLTLVRRLVELHGGTIAAASPGVGRGSEFTVRLPCVATAVPPGASPEPAGSGSSPRRHILIIEDNRDGRESLAMLLGLLGHRVEVAEDGLRGVEAALAVRPEVILIDIGLPGLDGYGVASRVRTALGGGVLLVALTGHTQPEDRQRATETGFDAHLTKPVGLGELQTLLARRLPGR
ncbi:MAG: hybrid sensor histidine kinase/response regulator [Gemmataceae bacterium]|nr:hybrid sensor histidine kinase/response regulator [Gemmataceae bacterium]